jgi:hypothetical protein
MTIIPRRGLRPGLRISTPFIAIVQLLAKLLQFTHTRSLPHQALDAGLPMESTSSNLPVPTVIVTCNYIHKSRYRPPMGGLTPAT